MSKDFTYNEDLSKEQENYFKDSKVRDSNGNLLICYHGTNNSNFKEFNAKNGKSQFGRYKFDNYNVNFFTTDKSSALSYTNTGNLYSCYINIVNPFIVDNKSTSDIKSSFNIRDDRIREKQIKLFDDIFNKWKNKYVSPNSKEFQLLNNDLHKLNLEMRVNDDWFDLYDLGNNSAFGNERNISYYDLGYTFTDDNYDELKEYVIGEDEDYRLTTDDVVRYVLAMNEDEHTDYDGIIIKDIKDNANTIEDNIGTDVITLKSSNQIKLIDNLNPTDSNRIDEEYENNIYYRGYDSRYGVFDSQNDYATLYTWLTDDLEYAKQYSNDNEYGKIAKVRITCSDKEIGSTFDLDDFDDYYDLGDEAFEEEILDKGLKGYGFYANEDESYCICVAKTCCEVIDDDFGKSIQDSSESVSTSLKTSNTDVLDEVYPHKGESKKDFISRFMSVTKNEYPDIKQRYAVALSYWDRRNESLNEEYVDEDKKIYTTTSSYDVKNRCMNSDYALRILYDKKLRRYFICNTDDLIHDSMAHIAFNKGYYHGLLNREWELVEELDNYSIHFIYSPTDKVEDTYGANIREDEYEYKYIYDFGVLTSREDSLKSGLVKAFGKAKSIEIFDGWEEDNYTPKVKKITEDLSSLKDKLINKLKSLGYNIKYVNDGWYDEKGNVVDWEDNREEPEDDWYYVAEPYYRCKNDSKQTSLSWRISEQSNNFTVVGIYGNYEKSEKGFATKTLDELLKIIPNEWTINIENNINKDYWNHIKSKYSNRNFVDVYESLNEYIDDDYIILYHNTPYKNVQSILKYGLLVNKSTSEKASGYQMTWATTHPLKYDAYGGTIIKFKLPKDYYYEKVNDDQYIIYQDIEPELILDVDVLIGDGGTGYMHQSEVKKYIDDFGKEEVKNALINNHSSQLTDEEVKKLTPELDWDNKKNESFKIIDREKNDSVWISYSIYDVKKEITSLFENETMKFIIDDKLNRYIMIDPFEMTHFPSFDFAVDNYCYPELCYSNQKIKNKIPYDEYVDSNLDINLHFITIIKNTSTSNLSYEDYFYRAYIYSDFMIITGKNDKFSNSSLYKILSTPNKIVTKEEINESIEKTINEFELGTCGYIKDDGTLIQLDEYHGEDTLLRDKKYPEFSNTHSEEDTCVRIFSKPNQLQYKVLEMIIDKYLDSEGYCKIEIWESSSKYNFYKVFSLWNGACQDCSWDEQVGNWTGYKLVQQIKNYFSNMNESISKKDLSKFYDEELKRQLDRINRFLDKYGFEVEIINDEDCLQELKDEDVVGMFFGSLQNNASVFPIALNKEMICSESENTTDVYYGIVGTLSHEVGHGIFRYCNDIVDLEDLDEEEVVEDFARDYEDNELEHNELMNIVKQTFEDNLNESLLLEKTRAQLINKSKTADDYAKNNQMLGRNRYERRVHSQISRSVATYNNIDMDAFFKRDILTVGIQVHGETDDYIVTIRFDGLLKELAHDIKVNHDKLEFKLIPRAMTRVFNKDNVFVKCQCEDFIFRQSFQADKGGYAIQHEPRPSNITNPHDTKGGGCKHILLVLSNLDWTMKVSSVINNYIKYAQEHLQKLYAEYIFPKLYGVPYKKAVQLSLFDNGWIPSDKNTLQGIVNKSLQGKDEKGRWVSGNKYQFNKSDIQKPDHSNEEPLFTIDKKNNINYNTNDEEGE